MAKSFLRRKRASGSLLSKIDRAIRRGWAPGRGRVRDFIRSKKKLQRQHGGEA
jgi:hypothetical protein